MKTKRLAQRILSAVISLATLLSISTISFASGSGFEGMDLGGNGQSTGENGYGASDIYKGFALNDQGYRLSLVNNDGTVFNNSVADLEIARDSNWRLTDTVTPTTVIGHSTATDPNSAGQKIGKPILIDKNVPKAIVDGGGKAYVGNGEAVKAWMMEKDSNNTANVLALVEQSFPELDEDTRNKIISGEITVELEPLLQMPIYNGNNFTGERVLATPRDYLAMLRERYPAGAGYSDYARMGGFMKPVLKAALQSMFLQNDDLGLKAMSKEEMDKYIEDFILNGDLNQIGAGLFIFDLGNKTTPPQPPQPQASTGSFNITQSRITRSVKLSDIDDTLYNYQFTWEVPKFDESIKDHMYGYYTHSSGATITDKTNVVIVTEEKKPDDKTKGSGIIGMWTFPTHSDPIPEYRQTWSDRNWGDQSFSTVINLNPVEYRVTAARQKSINDIISLISYRNNPNASAIIGATSTIKSGNKGDQRASNSGGSFAVDVEFKAGITDNKTVASHSDKFQKWLYHSDGSPKLDNAGNHKWTTEIKTKTDTKTTTVKSGADKLQMTLNVNWSTYSGTQNTASSTPAAGFTQIFKNGKQETWLEINYGTVSFYPYVRMQFDTVTTQGSQVYVAGKYQREFTANEHVGVIFNTSKNTGHSIVNTNFADVKGKISLQSNQWSTHATAVKNAGSNCVLPGGAVLDLAILKDDRQTFTVESIKPILSGSGQTQVNATGNSNLPTNDSQAKTEHKDFVEQVVKALEGLSVQQYISGTLSNPTSITKDVWNMSGAKAVSPTTQDSKYYFRPDNDTGSTSANANMGDIDVKQGKTDVVYYTFFSNTAGDIRCKTGTSLLETSTIKDPDSEGTVILSKGQTGITDKTIYNINEKTHIVDNLRQAIERNTGSDSDAAWASDGHWYNEAFDGITVIYQKTTLSLGTINPYVRSAVLDPELCPSSTSKSDLFTKYVASQFKMRDYSELWPGKIGKLAEYRGYEFTTQKLDQLFISDIFYIPNVTVQDLR